MATKDPNIEKMEAQIKEWGSKIESLVARAELAGDHVRADYRRRITELTAQGADARARLEEFKAAGTETWEAFRTGIEAAWKDLETALKEIGHEEPAPRSPKRAAGQRPFAPSTRPPASLPKAQVRHRTSHR